MKEHKRILIISYFFAPQNLIGAVRPTKLAKYLTRMGHEVTVICGGGLDGKTDPTLQRDLQQLPDVHQLNEWNPLRDWYIRKQARAAAAPAPAAPAAAAEPAPEPGVLKRLIKTAIDTVYVWLDWTADRCFKQMGLRELKKLQGTYDVVFSSYAPISVHEIARQAKKSGLAKKWIADFRDELNLPFACQQGRKQRTMKMLRREADILSAVSQGTLDIMQLGETGRVLYNGFDREDLPEMQSTAGDGCMRLVYCGQFNMGRRGVGDRDLTPAFRALAQLVQEGVLPKEKLRLVYAGTEGELMHGYASACGLESCVEDHGLVSREESIRLQKEADILLLASWNLAQQRGILTGKMFEYMMMDKPILCCMNGDLPDSAVKKLMLETGIGFCREEANAVEDDALMLDYLRCLIGKWKKGETLLDGENRTAVDAYAYPQLAATLESWISE